MKLTNLIDTQILRSGTDAPIGRCVDMILQTREAQVDYVLSDNGRNRALIARSCLSIRSSALVAGISQDRFDALDAEGAADDAGERPVLLDPMAMPPVLVGPFGNTVAPAMAASLAQSEFTAARDVARPAIDEKDAHWHWLGKIIGLPVFDTSREIGVLDDILIDPDTLMCRDLEVMSLSGTKRRLPFARLSHVSRQGDSIILRN